jgi:predicted phosphodiesterase
LLQKAAETATASDFLIQIEQAMSSLETERQERQITGGKITGGLIEIDDLQNIAIISDLHGDSKSLFKMLGQINYEQFLANPNNKMVFLGDYVDRGSDSIGVLYTVCYLKHAYPDSVILMRGNHEAPMEFPFSSHDLPYRIEDRFGHGGKIIYSRLLSMFKLLTLATVIEQRLLLVHGGLPTEYAVIENFKESIPTAQEDNVRSRVLEEILWNDPREIDNPPEWEVSRRGFGRHFGRSISRKWLESTRTKAVVRGHEPCQGFRIDHDGMILTLFSCKEPYPLFKAAFVLSSADHLDSIKNGKELSLCVKYLE